MTSSESKRRFDFTHACSKRIRLPEYALGAAADETLAFSSRGRDSSTLLQCVGNLCRQASKISMLLRPLGFADRQVRDRDAIVSTHAFGARPIRVLTDIPGQAERVFNREVRADHPASWGAGERGSEANSRAVALRLPRQACKTKLFHLLVDTRPHRSSETCSKCCLDDLEGAVMSDSPSDREDQILRLCLIVASDEVGAAFDEREANVFRLAAIVIEPKHAAASGRLRAAATRWFEARSVQPLTVDEIVKRGWIRGLAWLQDELLRRLDPKT